MSVSLVKKSLELISEDEKYSVAKRKRDNGNKRKKSKKNENVDNKARTVALVKRARKEAETKKKTNNVEANIEKLLNLSRTEIIHKKLENKLLTKVSRKTKECLEKPPPPPQQQQQQKKGSAFTEEDFAKFEREYFVDGCY